MSCQRCRSLYGNSPDGTFASSRPAADVSVLVYHQCAFDDEGRFKAANGNCATMCALRTLCDDTYYQTPPGKWTWSAEQQSLFTLAFGRKFAVIGAYKNRSSTEIALVIDEGESHPLALAEAEEAIEYWRKKPEWLKLKG